MGHGETWMWFGGPVMWTFFIVILVIAVRWISGPAARNSNPLEPLDILNTRYAKGEINQEEYEKVKKQLKETRQDMT